MGVEYLLVDKNNNERFEVGKGNLGFLFEEYVKTKSQPELYEWLLKNIAMEFDYETTLSFFHELSNELYNFISKREVRVMTEDLFFDEFNYDPRYYKNLEEFNEVYRVINSIYNIKNDKMNKEILGIKSYFYDIVEFKNDPRIYKRYESGYWVEIFDNKEYSVRDSELEEVYQEYLKKKENK